jgi:hypothetical protein
MAGRTSEHALQASYTSENSTFLGTLMNKTSSDASGLAEWHIYLRVKATKESAMTSSNLLRWGGLAAL